jgi:ferric-dicitrate binding protein FerR (iron transport regulator)
MKNLYSKYINNQLTAAELEELRKNNLSKHVMELEEAMHEEWNSDEDYSQISDDVVVGIKNKLDKAIDKERRTIIPLYYKVLGWAAVILFPLFILSTLHIYKEHAQAVSEEMIVETAIGEKATITLPDGTLVTLNSNSRLSYIPKVYNKNNRLISFSGEAYFNVAKDMKRPFMIDARGLKVEVLGTKFNLLVRKKDKNAELFLESGKVLFISLLKNKSVVLSPNQKLTMSQITGEISVRSGIDNMASAWRRDEMIFRNAPFETVVKAIENVYGVRILMNYKTDSLDVFTGTLVTNDLNSVLEVIEATNNLKAKKINNIISICRAR